jgi:hypothetical protein
MNIGWPQGIVLAMMAANLIVNICWQGKPKVDREGRPLKYSGLEALVRFAIWIPILYWGGFFR